jgi:hypothetical protein
MGVTGGASTAIRAASLTRISSRWRKQIVLDRGGDDGGECVKEQVSHQPQGPPPVTGNGRPLAPLVMPGVHRRPPGHHLKGTNSLGHRPRPQR